MFNNKGKQKVIPICFLVIGLISVFKSNSLDNSYDLANNATNHCDAKMSMHCILEVVTETTILNK